MFPQREKKGRNKQLVALYLGGMKRSDLATQFGITQGRVNQIIRNYNIKIGVLKL